MSDQSMSMIELSNFDFSGSAFEVPMPSAPPMNPLWVPPSQQAMCDDEPPQHLEWRGDEMLTLAAEGSETLFFRRHLPFHACNPCGPIFEFFQARDSSVSYRVNGRGPCQDVTLRIKDEDVATLKKSGCLDNGWGFATGLFKYATSIATLGVIEIRGQERFRILRKVNRKTTCGWQKPNCELPSEYVVVDQPLFDSLSSSSKRTSTVSTSEHEQVVHMKEQLRKTQIELLDLKMNHDSNKSKVKELKEQERRITKDVKTLWQQLALLRPVARSESVLRWRGFLCFGYWEPVRVMVTPTSQENQNQFSTEEMLAAGLLSVMHIVRGLNGPFLRAADEDLGARRHKLTYMDMLDHQVGKQKLEEERRKNLSVSQSIPPLAPPARPPSPPPSRFCDTARITPRDTMQMV